MAFLRRSSREFFSMERRRPSGLLICEAGPQDIDAISKLECDSFPEDRVSRRSFRYFLRAPQRPVIAATSDGVLAGYVLLALHKGARAVRIYSIAVDPRYGRRGVGLALMQASEAFAHRHGRASVTLEVRYDNAAAIALYEKCGYQQFGEHKDYYSDGATALRYTKAILPGAPVQTPDLPAEPTGAQRRRA
jgi:[ribosomal protein S18]-alanine N-acetyltransferase